MPRLGVLSGSAIDHLADFYFGLILPMVQLNDSFEGYGKPIKTEGLRSDHYRQLRADQSLRPLQEMNPALPPGSI